MPASALVHWDSAAGATVDRFALDWKSVYPVSRNQAPDWSRYDALYNGLIAAGIQPVLMITSAPGWAVDASASDCVAATSICAPTPDHDADFAAFAAQVAARYPRASAIEIWNEENSAYDWGKSVDPDHYASLLAKAYQAIKQVSSSMKVIMGSLTQHAYDEWDASGHVTTMSDGSYLGKVYESWRSNTGGTVFMDGIGVHPYGWRMSLDAPFQALDRLRDVRDAYGDSGRPLFATESGISPALTGVSESAAGGLVGELARVVPAPDVQGPLFHTLVDVGDGSSQGYGMLASSGGGAFNPKPAFCSLAAANGSSFSCPLAPTDSSQQQRWDAQVLLHDAYEVARGWWAVHHTFTSLTSQALAQGDPHLSATVPALPMLPGANAHPEQVFFVGNGPKLVLCNASRADLVYCMYRAGEKTSNGTDSSAAPVTYAASPDPDKAAGTALALGGQAGAWSK